MNHIKFWTAAFIHRTNMIHALLYFIAQDKKSQAEHLSYILNNNPDITEDGYS